ncbi:hypothetical protein C5167_014221, partial [Papaver somniferum]
ECEFMIDILRTFSRLKLENEFQYVLNPKGSTPADVLGIDYKTLKVAPNALTDDIKINSVAKLEEQISLQQQWTENAMKLQAKRILLVELQSKIDTIRALCRMVCARELLPLVDSASEYKESMGSIISEMKTVLSETAEAVETSFRGPLPANFYTSSLTSQGYQVDYNDCINNSGTFPDGPQK